jgi:hypothetical protein
MREFLPESNLRTEESTKRQALGLRLPILPSKKGCAERTTTGWRGDRLSIDNG